jgi:hypothetical protein
MALLQRPHRATLPDATQTNLSTHWFHVKQQALMRRWAEATRHLRWDEAEQLWRELMAEWLRPPVTDQGYWNRLLTRRMNAMERKEHRSAIDDAEWDSRHEDMGR